MALGCLLFVPASCSACSRRSWLRSSCCPACTIVQVVANPLISMLGEPATAHSRRTFAQAFNSLVDNGFPLVGLNPDRARRRIGSGGADRRGARCIPRAGKPHNRAHLSRPRGSTSCHGVGGMGVPEPLSRRPGRSDAGVAGIWTVAAKALLIRRARGFFSTSAASFSRSGLSSSISLCRPMCWASSSAPAMRANSCRRHRAAPWSAGSSAHIIPALWSPGKGARECRRCGDPAPRLPALAPVQCPAVLLVIGLFTITFPTYSRSRWKALAAAPTRDRGSFVWRSREASSYRSSWDMRRIASVHPSRLRWHDDDVMTSLSLAFTERGQTAGPP